MYSLALEPSRLSIAPGQEFDVSIFTEGPELIYGVDVELLFPAGALEVVSANFATSPLTDEHENVLSPGRLMLVRVIGPTANPISGRIFFGSVRFRALQTGAHAITLGPSCGVFEDVTTNNILQGKVDGLYTVAVVDTVPPAAPQGDENMLTQVGARLKAEYTEPTTNADTTPLTDLVNTEVLADWGQEGAPTVVATTPATSPQGGGNVEALFDIPMPAQGASLTVRAWLRAVDGLGNQSPLSEERSVALDVLAPAAPVWR